VTVRRPVRRTRRPVALVATGALALSAAAFGLGPGTAAGSSHREAPLTAAEPEVDHTDVYAFVPKTDPSDVAIVANWLPFEEPAGGPNFYKFSPDAHYDVNIDNTGDGKADITYRWDFTSHYRDPGQILYNTGVVRSIQDQTLNFYQTYDLYEIDYSGGTARTTTLGRDLPVAPSDVGDASMPNYAALRQQAIQGVGPNQWSFTGQADDPFFLDLRVFDLLYGGNFSEVGHDTLSRFNVQTIALQVPQKDLALKQDPTGNPVVGIWSTTERRSTVISGNSLTNLYQGPYVQLSRLGQPLVNEVVIPFAKKNLFNASNPTGDAQFLPYVTNPILPKIVQQVYGIPAPPTPRKDLVEVFLTGIYKGSSGPVQANLNSQLLNQDVTAAQFRPSEELRLNMAVPPTSNPNRLGVLGGDLAGFPNGRRLTDDIVDIELRVAEGALLPNHPAGVDALGDDVNNNDKPFPDMFPYVALPTSGSSTAPRG
jgi:hypothetical protein